MSDGFGGRGSCLSLDCHESSGLSPKMMQQMRLERLTSRRVAKDLEIMWSESQRRNGLVEVFLLSVFTSSIRPQELWYVHETPAITFNAKRRARDSENSGAFLRFLAPHLGIGPRMTTSRNWRCSNGRWRRLVKSSLWMYFVRRNW